MATARMVVGADCCFVLLALRWIVCGIVVLGGCFASALPGGRLLDELKRPFGLQENAAFLTLPAPPRLRRKRRPCCRVYPLSSNPPSSIFVFRFPCAL